MQAQLKVGRPRRTVASVLASEMAEWSYLRRPVELPCRVGFRPCGWGRCRYAVLCGTMRVKFFRVCGLEKGCLAAMSASASLRKVAQSPELPEVMSIEECTTGLSVVLLRTTSLFSKLSGRPLSGPLYVQWATAAAV